MLNVRSSRAIPVLAIAAAAFTALLPGAMLAQEGEDTPIHARIKVTDADLRAAANVKFSAYHVMPAAIPGARQKATALNAESDRRVAEDLGKETRFAELKATTLAKIDFYPADLVNSKGGTLTTVVNHAVYLNYKGTISANWGNPEGFLKDLFVDPFIHLTDQYTGKTTNGRYTVGANASVSYSLYGAVISEHELWAVAHSVASQSGNGGGTGHIYHIFLPQGLETCFDESSSCYSPSNPNAWSFCAYHGAVKFTDIGYVLFSIEPYQNVDGCAVASPYANSKLIDSTNSVLSHETFEAITDPISSSGWTNLTSLDEWGYEIGDECQPLVNSNYDFLVPTFIINKKKYEVQLEYSNTYHACTAQP